VHPPFFAFDGRCVHCCRCAVRLATRQAAMPDSPPSNSADAAPFRPLPPLPPGFRYQRVRNLWHESSPPPGLEPATAGGTGGAAPPAVGAAPRLPSATAGADTAAATSQTGGTPTTAGGCASLPESAATTGVDAVAPAKSGAALGGGDAIEVTRRLQPLRRRRGLIGARTWRAWGAPARSVSRSSSGVCTRVA